MFVNSLKSKLASGQTVVGIWSLIPSPILAEVFGVAGLDFQIFDMEHGVYDVSALDNSIRACELTGCSPLVRVPGLQQSMIQTVLDLGAHGVIVPQITDYNESVKAVQYMKYAPQGMRGFNPFTRAGKYNPGEKLQSKLYNEFGLSAIIIENITAYQDLESILTIQDLDIIYLGVYDMSVSLGHAGEVNHPLVKQFVIDSSIKIRDAGKIVGMMVKNESDINWARDLSAQFLVYSVDTDVIRLAISDMSSAVKGN